MAMGEEEKTELETIEIIGQDATRRNTNKTILKRSIRFTQQSLEPLITERFLNVI
jgi:hypothetical protein